MGGSWVASLLFAALCYCTCYEAVPKAEVENQGDLAES